MELCFSRHALERMKERGITQSKIRDVIAKPDGLQFVDRGRLILQKRTAKGILEIIIIHERNQIVIITAYFL